jgi:hypothetical protein
MSPKIIISLRESPLFENLMFLRRNFLEQFLELLLSKKNLWIERLSVLLLLVSWTTNDSSPHGSETPA